MLHIPTKDRLLLVTGASGYVGGRLVRHLVSEGFKVRIFVRDKNKVSGQPWFSKVEVVQGNANNFEETKAALNGVHTAYYLLHSINMGPHFDDIEAKMARNFADAANESHVQQIAYLGGIANDKNISKHLKSRERAGQELASGPVPVIELRAGIIIGSGSASFEMLRHLTHRLPIMTTPKWVSNLTQPIAIRDVLWYLAGVAGLNNPVNGQFDIGGPDVLSYADMMQTFAKLSGLRRRIIIKIPVLSPGLSSLWIGLVTPVPTALARPLVGSLISEVVADPHKSVDEYIPKPREGLLHLSDSINLALTSTNENAVETRWSDATHPAAPWQKAQGDPDWSGETLYRDYRITTVDIPRTDLWAAIERIGGDTGWYGADFLWWGRGLLDRIVGGVGIRRGRRDPFHLRVGDSLDFWRVVEIEPGVRLKLYAEMVLPGKAWLEFRLSELGEGEEKRVKLEQEATFSPRGLGGQLYWFSILPLHIFVFPTMIKNLVKFAAKNPISTS